MNPALLEHDQRTSFADEWAMNELEPDNYGIEGDVADEVYDGVEDAGIWGQDDGSENGGGGSGIISSKILSSSPFTPSSTTFVATGLSVPLNAGQRYFIQLSAEIENDAISGVALRFNAAAGLTVQAGSMGGVLYTINDSTPSSAPIEALASAQATSSNNDAFTNFSGEFVLFCTQAGNLIVEAAQSNVSGTWSNIFSAVLVATTS